MKKLYRKLACLCIASLAMGYSSHAQLTLTLQPGSEGKDAFIDSRVPSYNYGDHFDLAAISWTNMGAPTTCRGLIDFDLSVISDSADIVSAELHLNSYDSPANGAHYPLTHSNASVIRRITSAWNENQVNWANQPSTTAQNQVLLSPSPNPLEDYILTVTDMVQDMVNDPDGSHGFLLRLIDEEMYTRLVFASGDNEDPSLRPKLVVVYKDDINSISDTEEVPLNFTVYPSPTTDFLTIDFSETNRDPQSLELINDIGQRITRITTFDMEWLELDVSRYAKGVYFIKVEFDDTAITKKFVIQ